MGQCSADGAVAQEAPGRRPELTEPEVRDRYDVSRVVLLRGLGAVYFAAYVSLVVQALPLLGSRGLTPVARFLDQVATVPGLRTSLPTLFWLASSDAALLVAAWVGLVLSVGVLLGYTHALVQFTLWVIYLSFCNAGQVWYGYGWELLLLEAGFLAIFLAPVRSVRLSGYASPTPVAVLWLYRWLAARLMLGAGLIKLRGDPCWTELTCLDSHFETQPLPNPFSWYFHHLPDPLLHAMTAWNHVVELGVPWLFLGPRAFRRVAAALTIHFQLVLILSGNLSFFNWLSIVLCFAAVDDGWLSRLRGAPPPARSPVGRARAWASGVLVVLIAGLSARPVANLLSPGQQMNASFSAWRLVNTYGAFGSVGRERYEVVLEGSDDGVSWKAYEFPFKPGDPERAPPFVAPFQPRLDWQTWFAAQQEPSENLWLLHLAWKLLHARPEARLLLSVDPFPHHPPRYVRAEHYQYWFTEPGERGWWHRERRGTWFRPLTADDPVLVQLAADQGWSD